jgi:uncharacterized repeat protein (TIGR03803 family)
MMAFVSHLRGMGIALGATIAASTGAGVIVIQNVSPGATNWPGSPIIQTVSNPAGQATIGESFNAVGGCTNYCQTFTVTTTNYTLHTVCVYAGGGTGTSAGTNVTLRLFDLGTQSAPNPSPYIPGTDLLNSGNGLSITYTPQTAGVLQFDFTGSDQVILTNGRMYAFQMDGALNSSPFLWQRTVAETYAGGAAYRNQSWINGNNAREFALAVYGSVIAGTNSNTNTVSGPDGIVYHAFTATSGGVNQDGANPAAGLALVGGVLSGTTLSGGTHGAGTAFYLTQDGSNFVTVRSFANPPEPNSPAGEFAIFGNQFFGTSLGGGTAGAGSIFVAQTNGSVSAIRSFAAVSADNATNNGGASPGALLARSDGTLYGTATAGGAAASGTVFSVVTNGTSFSVLHNFTLLDSQTGTNADGAIPWGGLIFFGDKLFGTTSAGGAGGNGVVFSVGTNGANFTALHSFASLATLTVTNADGAIPYAGLVLFSNTLYGTTFAGGSGGRGTIFSIQTNGAAFTVLHHFSATDPVTATNIDGASPVAALILSSNAIYGTTSAGGAGAAGTVFSLNLATAEFTTLHSFVALTSYGTNADGAFPVSPVKRLGNALYGTTFAGGPGAAGTVFRVLIPPAPSLITNIILAPSGNVTLYFLGGPNTTNVIQAASSLVSPVSWLDVSTTIADDNGAWQFTDVRNDTNRFYRAYSR